MVLTPFLSFQRKQWNALPDIFRTSFFADFLTRLLCVDFYVMYFYVLFASKILAR